MAEVEFVGEGRGQKDRRAGVAEVRLFGEGGGQKAEVAEDGF